MKTVSEVGKECLKTQECPIYESVTIQTSPAFFCKTRVYKNVSNLSEGRVILTDWREVSFDYENDDGGKKHVVIEGRVLEKVSAV